MHGKEHCLFRVFDGKTIKVNTCKQFMYNITMKSISGIGVFT